MDSFVTTPFDIKGNKITTFKVELTPEQEEFLYSPGVIEIEVRKVKVDGIKTVLAYNMDTGEEIEAIYKPSL